MNTKPNCLQVSCELGVIKLKDQVGEIWVVTKKDMSKLSPTQYESIITLGFWEIARQYKLTRSV